MFAKTFLSITLLGLQLSLAWSSGLVDLHGRQPSSNSASMTMMNSMITSSSTQIAIATVCPVGANRTAARFADNVLATLPTSVLNDMSMIESTTAIASATLPGGSTTTFSSLAKRNALGREHLGKFNAMARLVVGPDGCQTLYAPTTTANCSTVVTPGAMPPVVVTDCDQFITFSSETLFSCAATPTFTPSTGASAVSTTNTLAPATSRPFSSTTTPMMSAGRVRVNELSYSAASGVPMSLPRQMMDPQQSTEEEKRQLLMYPGMSEPIMTELVTIAPSPSATVSSISFLEMFTKVMPIPAFASKVLRDSNAAGQASDMRLTENADATNDQNAIELAQLSPPSPTKHYAAPWYEIAEGGVPTQVRAIVCSGGLAPSPPSGTPQPDTDGDTEDGECTTYNEEWSVTTLYETRIGTKIASFDGPAVLTFGSTTRTTVIHFTQTITTTTTIGYPSVSHITLGTLSRMTTAPTVTEVRTNPGSTQTVSLLPIESASAAAFSQTTPSNR